VWFFARLPRKCTHIPVNMHAQIVTRPYATFGKFFFCKMLFLSNLHIWLLCRSRATGWRRLIGCLKLQVIFRERATNYRAFLRKITCKDKASYGSSPPCTQIRVNNWVLCTNTGLSHRKFFFFKLSIWSNQHSSPLYRSHATQIRVSYWLLCTNTDLLHRKFLIFQLSYSSNLHISPLYRSRGDTQRCFSFGSFH